MPPTNPLPPEWKEAVREYYMKERANLLDRLTWIEAQYPDMPRSVVPKQERRAEAYTQRVRAQLRRED